MNTHARSRLIGGLIVQNGILSFMHGHASYNQIFLAENDIHKTAYRCLGAPGTYEWNVMPFDLKNAGFTNQRAMNLIFHVMIEKHLEVYIDDIPIKSENFELHL